MNPLTARQIAEILGTSVAAGNPDALASGGQGGEDEPLVT